MQHEIELKLAIAAQDVPILAAWLNTQADMNAAQSYKLRNIYLDTPDLVLAEKKAALRFRDKNGQWLQTFKTLGHSEKGLSARLEWETPAGLDQKGEPYLNINAFAEDFLGSQAVEILSPILPKLTSVFHSDFQRQTWTWIPAEGAEIEIALDQGVIHVPGRNKTCPICEVELEAKTTEATLYLLECANRLGQIVRLTPDDVSKAQRGYALFDALA
jgi:triphosphatase